MDSQELNRLVKQLKHRDPAQRREAVIALGKSKNSAALQPLADVYRADPDEAIRELAIKAGRHLRKTIDEMPAPAPAAKPEAISAPPLYEDNEKPARPAVIVTDENRESARVFVEEALSLNMRGNNTRAVKSLRKALELNPNLAEDSYFTSVAGAVMELDPAAVIDSLRDSSQVQNFVKTKEKEKKDLNTEEHMEEVNKFPFASVSLDLIIFLVISVLGSILSSLIIAQSARGYIDSVNNGVVSLNPDMFETASSLAFGQADPVSLILFSLASGAVGMVSLIIQAGIVHVAAKYILRGHGTLSYLLYKILNIYNRYLVISFVVSTLAIWFMFTMGAPFVLYCFMIPLGIFTLLQLFRVFTAIGETYNFGTGMGCVAALLGTIGIFVVFGCVFAIAGAALGAALQQFMVAPGGA